MAWQGQRRQGQGKKGNGATAGAFRSKKDRDLFVARFDGKWFKALVAVVKEATQQEEPGLVLFIRKNTEAGEKGPLLKVSAAVDKPLAKNKIKEDPADDADFGDFGSDAQEEVEL